MKRHENYEEVARPVLHDDAGKNPEALIAAIRGGDADAFANYYLGYSHSLTKLLVNLLNNEDDANEIVQETFARLWEKRKTFDPHTSLNGFVAGTARHLAMDFLREKQKGIEVTNLHFMRSEYADLADDGMLAEELTLLVEAALAIMPPQRRKVFEMSRKEGLTHNEIAKQLGLSYSTVKNHIFCALKDIRSILGAFIVILSNISL